MAYMQNFVCSDCGDSFQSTSGGRCSGCSKKEEKRKRDEYFAQFEGMTLAERVRALEERLYDLERRPPVYVPPPTY